MTKSDLRLCLRAMPLVMGFFAFLIGIWVQADRSMGITILLGVIAGLLADIVILMYNVHFGDIDRDK